MKKLPTFIQVILLIGILILFFVGLELMGDSFKLMGKGVAETLLATTANPFVGLFIGILATSLVQSSSTVTSMTVSIVAGGGLTVAGAVPIIMGANIGTSVTNTIVSLGHVTHKTEFERAMAGATVHDFFNIMAVLILFPLELTTQVITRIATGLTEALAGVGGTELLSPVKLITDPAANFFADLLHKNGVLVLILGLLFLFIALRYLVVLLKSLVLGRSEAVLHKYIFGKPAMAMFFGLVITFLVQSSSITTSVTVPLVAAGIVSVPQIFPFVLGANIGTTTTALIAALATAAGGGDAGIAALTVAFAHFTFNVMGIAIIYPIRFIRNIPIKLSYALGRAVVKNRAYALVYIGVVFFLIPLTIIFLTRGKADFYEPATVEGVEPNPTEMVEGEEGVRDEATAVPLVLPDSNQVPE